MKRIRRHFAVLASLVLALAAGCSSTSWERKGSITSGSRLIVETEEQVFKGEPKDAGFSHPAIVAPEGLSALLLYLKYEYPGVLSTTREPVFAEELVHPLAAAMAEGLKQCGPSQRVRFSAVNIHRQLKLLPVGKTTRGVVFVNPEGVLNIAFDLVDDDPNVDVANELQYEEWEDPTRRTISTFAFVQPPGTSFYRDPDGREHRLWLVVPFSTITPEPPQPPREPGPPGLPQRAPAAPEPEPGEADQGPPSAPATEQTPGPEATGGAGEKQPKRMTDQERMHRLRYLQDLFERRLIDEDEYRREWTEIFNKY